MAADRGVDPTGDPAVVGADQPFVQRLAHAVQALELEVAPVAGELDDAAERLGVVGRELRIERLAAGEQAPRAGEIGHVGRELAREHRVVVQALLLGALDLGVPVRALDQAHRDAAPRARGQRLEPGDDVDRPLLIGLDGEADAVPAGELGRGARRSNRSSEGSRRSVSSASMVTAMSPRTRRLQELEHAAGTARPAAGGAAPARSADAAPRA